MTWLPGLFTGSVYRNTLNWFPGIGQAVVSLERKMHVLVKRFAPGDAAWALRVERDLGVDESHVAGSRLPKRLSDRIELRVGAKTQRVQVARPKLLAVRLAGFALRLQ